MATLKVSEEQLRLIQRALDLYSRIGIGQFEEIKNHPTFQKHLANEYEVDGKTDYTRYHLTRDMADNALVQARNMLYNDFTHDRHSSWGIHNPNVDDSCRDAYDLIQVIRHEFWKRDTDRSSITVDSSVHLVDHRNSNIEVEL